MDIDQLEALTAEVYASADPARADALRTAAETVEDADAGPARRAAVRGGAFLVVHKLSTLRTDLDQAIEQLGIAVAIGSTPTRQANLASALLERCGLVGVPDDHSRAVELLHQALAEPDITATSEAARMITLLSAFVDAVERGFGKVTISELIDYGESVVARHPLAQAAEAENLLGCAYMLAAQRGHERADLRRMVKLLDEAAAHLPTTHPDLPARRSNLAAALLDRHEIKGNEDDLQRALTLGRQAVDGFPPGHPSRALALNNYVNAVVAGYERSGDTNLLLTALDAAPELIKAFTTTHPLYPVAHANVGIALRQAAQVFDRPELLDDAVGCQETAVAHTSQDSALLAGRIASLALAYADRYRRNGDTDDLARAIHFGTRSLTATSGHDAELSGFAVNMGNFLHERYLLAGRLSDLHAAADLHVRGLRRLPESHHDRASALNNAGIVWLDLYDRLGESDALNRAASYLAQSVTASGDTEPELPARLVNLAAARHRQAALEYTDERLGEADVLARRALATSTRAGTVSAAKGILVDIGRDRWRQSEDSSDLQRMVELDEQLEPTSPAGHLRRGITRGLVGDRDNEQRHLLAALDGGVASRPAVAISAAQLLADHGLRVFASGDRCGLDTVERASAAAILARDQLVSTGEVRQADLSWHRDLQGLGALWAHARWLRGDLDGAVDAFEQTRAVLLTKYFPDAAELDTTYLALWATPVGGAAVAVRPGRSPATVALPHLTPAIANRLADRLATAAVLGPRSRNPALGLVATRISDLITGPLGALLTPGEPVVCAAGGALALLPISLGEVDGRPLVTRNPLTLALHRRSAAWARDASGPVDMADAVSIACPTSTSYPPLPSAAVESAAFAPPERCIHGADSTPEALLDAFKTAPVVHVATHVGTHTNDPLAQHFVLADDSPLFADTVLDAAPLAARLAILSGCDTGRTTIAHADEGLALVSVVHAAGVPCVLSSLWSVLDLPTSRFMRTVVSYLNEGRTPRDALRAAQLRAIDEERRPADWAAFTLLGA